MKAPIQHYCDLHSDALAWHDKGRRDWVGHTVRIDGDVTGTAYMVVDRVSDIGEGWYRLHLIPTD